MPVTSLQVREFVAALKGQYDRDLDAPQQPRHRPAARSRTWWPARDGWSPLAVLLGSRGVIDALAGRRQDALRAVRELEEQSRRAFVRGTRPCIRRQALRPGSRMTNSLLVPCPRAVAPHVNLPAVHLHEPASQGQPDPQSGQRRSAVPLREQFGRCVATAPRRCRYPIDDREAQLHELASIGATDLRGDANGPAKLGELRRVVQQVDAVTSLFGRFSECLTRRERRPVARPVAGSSTPTPSAASTAWSIARR